MIIEMVDSRIDQDPLIDRVVLNESESQLFRRALPELYAEGRILIEPTSGKTEYRYRRVIVELYDADKQNLLLG